MKKFFLGKETTFKLSSNFESLWAYGENTFNDLIVSGSGDYKRFDFPILDIQHKGIEVGSTNSKNEKNLPSGYKATLLDSNGDVYIFGNFGTKKTSIEGNLISPINLNLNHNEKVIQIASGFFHILMLTNHSRIFAIGINHFGQFGVKSPRETVEPVEVLNKQLNKVISIHCNAYQTYFLNDKNELLSVGNMNKEGFISQIDLSFLSPNDEIAYLVTGNAYSNIYIMTKKNRLFVLGDDKQAMGLGNKIKKIKTDKFYEINLSFLRKYELPLKIAVGYWHTILLTNQGRIYTWGSNQYSQCGFKRKKQNTSLEEWILEPTLLDPKTFNFNGKKTETMKTLLKTDPNVIEIYAGFYHSLIKYGAYEFVFGENSHSTGITENGNYICELMIENEDGSLNYLTVPTLL
jgi:alpha-tubulin suppressor-like RCC1 family protein